MAGHGFDLILFGGRVVDGTGAAARPADVAVAGERIAAVGSLGDAEAGERIAVEGRVVCPGFIDMHSHSDYTILEFPAAQSRIGQGITTELVGNCGYSPGPVAPKRRDETARWSAALSEQLTFDWTTLEGFMERVQAAGLATNFAPMVGHAAVRVAAMGFADRAPTPKERAAMERLVAEAMEGGAFGLSTGLIYPPAAYAQTDEVIAMAKVAARYGGIYATHMRDEADGIFGAIDEALTIGREAALPVEISHLKLAGMRQWGRMGDAVRRIEAARAGGQDVAADFYPYDSGSTFMYGLLPPSFMAGGVDGMMRRVDDPVARRSVARAIEEGVPGWWNPVGASGGWQTVTVVSLPSGPNRALEGLNMTEIAERRGVAPVDAALDLLREEEGAAEIVIRMMVDADVAVAAATPWVMMGTDGQAIAPGPGIPPTHPRAYGTVPRFLGEYVREKGTATLEGAIHRMTGLPAARLGLADRGRVAEGMAADLVVLDPATVADRATYADPHVYPAGIDLVTVNGTLAWRDERSTGALSGRVLRRGQG